VWEKWNR